MTVHEETEQLPLAEKPSKAARLSAGDLLRLLAARHAGDVFVPECKDGPSQSDNHLRLDAWAMAKSWAHPRFWGYEIKVSRGDWLRDQKVHAYLPLCSDFYIVAPSGIIDPKELPEGAGLLVANAPGTGLLTKRRAAHRLIEPPTKLLLYVLMSRARIDVERRAAWTPEERAEAWHEYIEGKRKLRELGYRVSAALQRDIRERVESAEERAHQAEKRTAEAERKAEGLAWVADFLGQHGIDADRCDSWIVRRDLERLLSGSDLRQQITATRAGLERIEAMLTPKEEAL